MIVIIFLCFVLLIFIPMYFWHKARKMLTKSQTEMDIDLTSKQDLLCLLILLGGYLFIYFYPYQITLLLYLITTIVFGIVVQIDYYTKLKKWRFKKLYMKNALIYSTLLYFITTLMGMYLILLFNS